MATPKGIVEAIQNGQLTFEVERRGQGQMVEQGYARLVVRNRVYEVCQEIDKTSTDWPRTYWWRRLSEDQSTGTSFKIV